VAVDGDDNVWVSNFPGERFGIVELCGANSAAWPPGKKMGDAISPPGGYVGGGLQMQVDVDIDPAGNVWVGNNWQNLESVLDRNAESLSTLGAGQGLWFSTDWQNQFARRSSAQSISHKREPTGTTLYQRNSRQIANSGWHYANHSIM
jgi:hypothetical protein